MLRLSRSTQLNFGDITSFYMHIAVVTQQQFVCHVWDTMRFNDADMPRFFAAQRGRNGQVRLVSTVPKHPCVLQNTLTTRPLLPVQHGTAADVDSRRA
jgi:hypothetical protein